MDIHPKTFTVLSRSAVWIHCTG